MIPLIIAIISLSWLLTASIIDLKTREIPDWLTYSLAILSLSSYTYLAIEQKNISVLLISLSSGFLFGILAFLLYYTRQWGGGDVKLFIALGFSSAIYPSELLKYFSPNINLYFPLIILTNLVIAAMLYSLAALTFLIIKNNRCFLQEFKKHKSSKIKLICIILAITIFALSFSLRNPSAMYSIILAILILIFPYLLLSTRIIEKIAMTKAIPLEKAVGEWLAEDIIINNKLILSKKTPEIRYEDIKKLKRYSISSIKIKIGIPFAPTFLLALILSLLFGNLLFTLF